MISNGKMAERRGKIALRVRFGMIATILAMSACAQPAPRPEPIPAAPTFDPIVFFAGRTEGHGKLRILLHHTRSVEVRGRGVVSGSAITLDQDVTRAGKPAQHRAWHLRRTAPGRYAGTLSDAVGPVAAQSYGNVLYIAFKSKGGLQVNQTLTLQPGGQSALNVMTVRKLGIVVAHLDEWIVRLD